MRLRKNYAGKAWERPVCHSVDHVNKNQGGIIRQNMIKYFCKRDGSLESVKSRERAAKFALQG